MGSVGSGSGSDGGLSGSDGCCTVLEFGNTCAGPESTLPRLVLDIPVIGLHIQPVLGSPEHIMNAIFFRRRPLRA